MAPGRVATVSGGADYELSSRGRDVPGRKCDAGRIQTFLPGRLHERLSVRVLPSETSGRKDGPVRTLLAVAFKRVRASAAEPHLSISPVKENISSASKGARGCLSTPGGSRVRSCRNDQRAKRDGNHKPGRRGGSHCDCNKFGALAVHDEGHASFQRPCSNPCAFVACDAQCLLRTHGEWPGSAFASVVCAFRASHAS